MFFVSFIKDAFDRGVKAFERGDYKTALKQWHFSTLDGNGTAANNIGKMYRNGNVWFKTTRMQLNGS